jgi:hypothetical protein
MARDIASGDLKSILHSKRANLHYLEHCHDEQAFRQACIRCIACYAAPCASPEGLVGVGYFFHILSLFPFNHLDLTCMVQGSTAVQAAQK